MPSSVHKILNHGADIIQYAALPIGMLSKEALESRNKDFRNIREYHTRKMSREKIMYDFSLSSVIFRSYYILFFFPAVQNLWMKNFLPCYQMRQCQSVI